MRGPVRVLRRAPALGPTESTTCSSPRSATICRGAIPVALAPPGVQLGGEDWFRGRTPSLAPACKFPRWNDCPFKPRRRKVDQVGCNLCGSTGVEPDRYL